MKNGFTLIELLGVLAILAIIALIATPIILNIIRDTKEKAFEQTVNGIVKSAMLKALMELKTEEILYKYENNKWGEFKLNIDGETPKYIEVKVNKYGKVRYAITDGVYSFIKNEYDGKVDIKKIGNKNNDIQIQEEYCKLDAVIPTDESCFEYSESANSIRIKEYYCYEGNSEGMPVITDVVIPEQINGKAVTEIGIGCFYENGLTSVVIPDSVTNIEKQSFTKNKLTKITFSKNITEIGYAAFYMNSISSVVIPESITYIDELAFYGNKLTNVTMLGDVTYIGRQAFCRNLLTEITIPDSVTTIGNGAFSNNKLTSLIIPSSVIKIEEYAFDSNKLTNIKILGNLNDIGKQAFYDNLLTEITIPESVLNIGDYAFSNNKLTKVTIKGKTSIQDFAKYGSKVFGWASGYDDSNITWEGSS